MQTTDVVPKVCLPSQVHEPLLTASLDVQPEARIHCCSDYMKGARRGGSSEGNLGAQLEELKSS